jgi:hypothetical protein
MVYGHVLQGIAKGSALRIHLINIEPLLQGNRHPDRPKPVLNEEEEDNEREVCDEDLEAVWPSAATGGPIPLWQSYWDWFRLLLVHFQAVDVLTESINRQKIPADTPISIQVLIPPRVDDKLLPWRDLLTDKKLFPTFSSGTLHKIARSNDDILRFLEEGTRDISKWSKAASDARKAWEASNTPETIRLVQFLQQSRLPGWDVATHKLLKMLADPIKHSSHITDMMRSLCESTWLFTRLSVENKFKGALHCEATLASFADHSNNLAGSKYEGVSAAMKVSCHFQLAFAFEFLFLVILGLWASYRSI